MTYKTNKLNKDKAWSLIASSYFCLKAKPVLQLPEPFPVGEIRRKRMESKVLPEKKEQLCK